MGFSTPSYGLGDFFARIDRGDLQLPDFQRKYIWDVDRIRSLIVTVLRGYPVGCFMSLDTRDAPVRFKSRPISGAPDTGSDPGMLLLDGQQRVTTLYHCFNNRGFVDSTDFRGRAVSRQFFVDVALAVGSDVLPDEAVFAVDEQGQVRSHFAPRIDGGLATREAAVAAGCVPVAALLHEAGTDILFEIAERGDEQARARVKEFFTRIYSPLRGYQVPMIRLSRETARSGVGSIFAQANSAGVQMDVPELLTAVFAAEDESFSLAADWAHTEEILRQYPALDEVDQTAFLTAVALLVGGRRGHAAGQREDILALTLADYRPAAAALRITLREAAEFLRQRCILSLDQVPYTSQILPLAVIFALLADDPKAMTTTRSWDRLNRWFWSGVFGELYGSAAVINRMAHDVDQVTGWVRGLTDEEPATVRDAVFHADRLASVDRHSGIYHGIYALLMGRGARDWRTASPFDRWTYEDLDPSFAMIFPERWCREAGIEDSLAHSVLNRTPMSKRTEVVLEGSGPSRYLPRVQAKSLMDDAEFDHVLAGHELDPQLMRVARDAEAARVFFADRRERLLRIVAEAMGKEVIRDGE